jgi:hypothetical protein
MSEVDDWAPVQPQEQDDWQKVSPQAAAVADEDLPASFLERFNAGAAAHQREEQAARRNPGGLELLSSPEGRTKLWDAVKAYPQHFLEGMVNLRRMWKEDGITPAEAVHDAQTDAFLKHDITAKQVEVKLDPADLEVLTETGGKPGSLGAAATEPGDIPLTSSPRAARQPVASIKAAADTLLDIGRDAQMLVAPMARGTTDSMAIAKDFANALRRNRWDWDRIDTDVAKRFTPEQRARMWTAADEESVSLQLGEPAHMREHQGLATLEPPSAPRRGPADPGAERMAARARRSAWSRARGFRPTRRA